MIPLTKERRAVIAGFLKFMVNQPSQPYYDFIVDVLADSAYWREAVREANHRSGNASCNFCNTYFEACKPDCPWVKAQEEG